MSETSDTLICTRTSCRVSAFTKEADETDRCPLCGTQGTVTDKGEDPCPTR